MNGEQWQNVITEAEPYKGIFENWMKNKKTRSRLEIYSQVDSYPISNLAKMHIIANFFMGVVIEGMFGR